MTALRHTNKNKPSSGLMRRTAAAGIACPSGLDGKDLSAADKENGKAEKWAAAGDTRTGSEAAIQSAAYAENGKKLILNRRIWELFNLQNDPGEITDIAEKHPDTFLKMASGCIEPAMAMFNCVEHHRFGRLERSVTDT